ncbi:MAG: FAD-dependent oxidoreductase [Rhodospirillaceae bacterium]|nr:FAD-dependent oxidoreductase [Rhodospirillaceae bacterium]MBT5455492.1 FAD-dependent oxidoreductase [Rhodospirillaceae bacterium]
MKKIIVIGGGLAGFWAAAAAARNLDLHRIDPDEISVTVINRDPYHAIRVRNYEADLSDVRVALAPLLATIDVAFVEAEVTGLDLSGRRVILDDDALSYDRLIFAAGSRLNLPDIPGLSEHGFDVDTTDAGDRLNTHIANLGKEPAAPGRNTAIVVGAGLTGIEAACELPAKFATAGITDCRVILIDQNPHIGSDMGEEARGPIMEALTSLGIETRTSVSVTAVDAEGITLADGERIPSATIVWTAGVQASPLTSLLPVARDTLGRVSVDPFMRVAGIDNVLAAGDIASAMMDETHPSVMSCQHGRPMGRFAGHNAVADLLGEEMLALRIPHYGTCLDLGPWGALYTEGWDRRVRAQGPEAKKTKMTINCDRIYPPRSGARADILAAAEPVIQTPPREAAE